MPSISQTCIRFRCAFLLLFVVVYPAIFVPMVFLQGLPLEVSTDLGDFVKSDADASLEYDAVETSESFTKSLFNEYNDRFQTRRLQSSSFERSESLNDLILMYRATNGDIFAQPVLEDIRRIEQGIMNLPGFSRFCISETVEDASRCANFNSIVSLFFPSVQSDGLVVFDGQGDFFGRAKGLELVESTSGALPLVDKAFLKNNQSSPVARSVGSFGTPLAGYSSRNDRFREQSSKLDNEFIRPVLYPYLLDASTDNVRVMWYNDLASSYEIEVSVIHDATVACGSLVFVFVLMILHSRSLFNTCFAVLCILYAFPLTYCVVAVLLGRRSMSIFNVVSFFVLIGIGADDFFVFADLWKQSSLAHGLERDTKSLAKRFTWTYRHASLATLITSCTTAVSFLSNLASPVVPIRDFGLFMGVLIMSNYLVMVTIVPLSLVVQGDAQALMSKCKKRTNDTYVGYCDPEASRKGTFETETDSEDTGSLNSTSIDLASKRMSRGIVRGGSAKLVTAVGNLSKRLGSSLDFSVVSPQGSRLIDSDDVDHTVSKADGLPTLIVFLHNTFAGVVIRKYRFPLVLALGSLSIIMVALAATRLELASDLPEFFAESQNLGAIERLQREHFGAISGFNRDISNRVVTCQVDPETKTCVTNTCPNSCSGNGLCYRNLCVCDGSHYSTDCSLEWAPENLNEIDRRFWPAVFGFLGGSNWPECSDSLQHPCGCDRINCQPLEYGSSVSVIWEMDLSGMGLSFVVDPTMLASLGTVLSQSGALSRVDLSNNPGITLAPTVACIPGCGEKLTCVFPEGLECPTLPPSTASPTLSTDAPTTSSPTAPTTSSPTTSRPTASPVQPTFAPTKPNDTPSPTRQPIVVTPSPTSSPTQQAVRLVFEGGDVPYTSIGSRALPLDSANYVVRGTCTNNNGQASVDGKVMLIQFDNSCSSTNDAVLAAQSLDAAMVVFFNVDNDELILSSSADVQIPVVVVSGADGSSMDTEIGQGNNAVYVGERPAETPNVVVQSVMTVSVENDDGASALLRIRQQIASKLGIPIDQVVVQMAEQNRRRVLSGVAPAARRHLATLTVVVTVQVDVENGGQVPGDMEAWENDANALGPGVLVTQVDATIRATPVPTSQPTKSPVIDSTTANLGQASLWLLQSGKNATEQPISLRSGTMTVPIPYFADSAVLVVSPSARVGTVNCIVNGSVNVPALQGDLEGVLVDGKVGFPISIYDTEATVQVQGDNGIERTYQFDLFVRDAVCDGGCVYGTCVADDMCECDDEHIGRSCAQLRCPGDCSSHGACGSVTDGVCQCNNEWEGEDCSKLREEVVQLPDARVSNVLVSFGVDGFDRETSTVQFDDAFNPAAEESQQFLTKSCSFFDPNSRNASTALDSLNVRRVSNCFPISFFDYCVSSGIPYPVVPESVFHETMFEYANREGSSKYVGFDANRKVNRISFEVKSNLDNQMGATEGYDNYLVWDDFVKSTLQGQVPASLGKVVHTSELWARSVTETEAVRGTLIAMVISTCSAFISIFVFTGDIILAFFTTLTIILIVGLLFGIMVVIMQNPFGTVEAIAVTIFVGMSVDYCLHLGHAYHESKCKTRFGKVRHALAKIGSSTMAAGLTSMGSSLFLVFCKIQVFVLFGIIFAINIILSCVYALLFFCSLLSICGPINSCNLFKCVKACKSGGADPVEGREQLHDDSNAQEDAPEPRLSVGGDEEAGTSRLSANRTSSSSHIEMVDVEEVHVLGQ